MDEPILIELYWKRDESALTKTEGIYGAYIRSIAHNILRNVEDVQECKNDTLLQVWNSIPQDRPRIFRAYIGRIARNLSINRYQMQRTKKRGGGELELIFEELENVISDHQGPEAQLEGKELLRSINAFLAELPSEQRRVFVARYWYGKSISELSVQFISSESRIKTMLFRIREALREELDKEGIRV
ncbi:MAG: RNA polymerase sigma factor [Tissierellia bacterium]|nr:RNA polymerase sigma factor [Tissierellia bacterium]